MFYVMKTIFNLPLYLWKNQPLCSVYRVSCTAIIILINIYEIKYWHVLLHFMDFYLTWEREIKRETERKRGNIWVHIGLKFKQHCSLVEDLGSFEPALYQRAKSKWSNSKHPLISCLNRLKVSALVLKLQMVALYLSVPVCHSSSICLVFWKDVDVLCTCVLSGHWPPT